MKEKGLDNEQELRVTDIPKIQYKHEMEKKNTLQLSFLTLKCRRDKLIFSENFISMNFVSTCISILIVSVQKVLEELIDDCQLYDAHSEVCIKI